MGITVWNGTTSFVSRFLKKYYITDRFVKMATMRSPLGVGHPNLTSRATQGDTGDLRDNNIKGSVDDLK